MKKILCSVLGLSLAGMGALLAQETSPNTLVWCGLDYSMVKMIGTMDFFQPQQIFPGMLTAWNGLFMKEMLPELENMAKSVRADTDGVEERNSKATANQIEHKDGSREEMVKASHIIEANIAEAVASYKLKSKQGLGLVFIMDRLVKAQRTGCLYVVFFDVATRKVIHSERMCAEAAGMGFRNYWFRPVKTVVGKLPKIYREAKAKRPSTT